MKDQGKNNGFAGRETGIISSNNYCIPSSKRRQRQGPRARRASKNGISLQDAVRHVAFNAGRLGLPPTTYLAHRGHYQGRGLTWAAGFQAWKAALSGLFLPLVFPLTLWLREHRLGYTYSYTHTRSSHTSTHTCVFTIMYVNLGTSLTCVKHLCDFRDYMNGVCNKLRNGPNQIYLDFFYALAQTFFTRLRCWTSALQAIWNNICAPE